MFEDIGKWDKIWNEKSKDSMAVRSEDGRNPDGIESFQEDSSKDKWKTRVDSANIESFGQDILPILSCPHLQLFLEHLISFSYWVLVSLLSFIGWLNFCNYHRSIV